MAMKPCDIKPEKLRTPSRIAVRHAARVGQSPKDLALPILKFLLAGLSGDPALVRHQQSVALPATVRIEGSRSMTSVFDRP
jgi:hypothetical protein